MSQGQQRSPHEEFIMVTIVAGLTFAFCYTIWFFFHEQLTTALRWVRVCEMWIATLMEGKDYSVHDGNVLLFKFNV